MAPQSLHGYNSAIFTPTPVSPIGGQLISGVLASF